MQFKDEHADHVDETAPLLSMPANQSREKRRSSGVRTKGHIASSFEVASSKTSKPGKGSVFDGSSVPEENQDSHRSTTKSRKKQKMPVSKVRKAYHLFSLLIIYANFICGLISLLKYIFAASKNRSSCRYSS